MTQMLLIEQMTGNSFNSCFLVLAMKQLMLLVEYITGITFNSLLPVLVLAMAQLMLLIEYITGTTFNSCMFVLTMTQLMLLVEYIQVIIICCHYAISDATSSQHKAVINNSLIMYVKYIFYYSCHINKCTPCSTSTASALSGLVIGTLLLVILSLYCKAQLCVWRTLSSRQTLLYKFVSCVPYYRSGNKMKNT